jgi:coproporphyrinogen III oxidase-like Fe-S oxidoreductase
MITLHSILEEFMVRIEPEQYVDTVDAHPMNLENFEEISDQEKQRAGMILSSLIRYGYEPDRYYYDRANRELLLGYSDQDFVGVFSLINVHLSE